MRRPTDRGHNVIAVVIALLLLVAAGGPVVRAQEPDEATRPYVELPYGGQKAFRVTCGYGCYQHRGSMYYAVDFAIPDGEPILAAADGTVMAITWEIGLPVSLNLGDALILYIDHGHGWFTRYVHLDGVTVEVGDEVRIGDIVGYSGKTGASSEHLHFELKYGSSLHSPSVPLDELFDGQAPAVGDRYVSNNYSLDGTIVPQRPTAAAAAEPTVDAPRLFDPTATVAPTPAPAPAPTSSAPLVAPGYSAGLPRVEAPLVIAEGDLRVGRPVTVTFTLHNTGEEPLRLSMLGIGQRDADGRIVEQGLLFDRNITLNPDRSYRFEQRYTFREAGVGELFVFALGPEREWLPLTGRDATGLLEIGGAQLFIPLSVGAPPLASDASTPDVLADAILPGER